MASRAGRYLFGVAQARVVLARRMNRMRSGMYIDSTITMGTIATAMASHHAKVCTASACERPASASESGGPARTGDRFGELVADHGHVVDAVAGVAQLRPSSSQHFPFCVPARRAFHVVEDQQASHTEKTSQATTQRSPNIWRERRAGVSA